MNFKFNDEVVSKVISVDIIDGMKLPEDYEDDKSELQLTNGKYSYKLTNVNHTYLRREDMENFTNKMVELDLMIKNMLINQHKLDTDIMNSIKVVSRMTNKSGSITSDSLLNSRYLALVVELSEMVNDRRSFKYWSSKESLDILGELVDVLHFILSIILLDRAVVGMSDHDWVSGSDEASHELTLSNLLRVYESITSLVGVMDFLNLRVMIPAHRITDSEFNESVLNMINKVTSMSVSNDQSRVDILNEVLEELLILAEWSGYTMSDVYDAYVKKVEVNHNRLDGDY